MKKIQCELCGSIDFKKVNEGLFQCQYCGVQYSQADMKNLLVEIIGEVSIDKSKETKNILKLAYDSFNGQNYQQAYSFFTTALQNDYNNYEATFMKGLSSAYQSTLANHNIAELVQSTSNALQILYSSEIKSENNAAVFRERIARDIATFVISFHNISLEHFNEFREVKTAASEFLNRTFLLASTMFYAGSLIDEKALDANYEYENTYHWIGSNGKVLCDLAKQTIRYKNGSYEDTSMWDGSTVFRDNYANASLGSEELNEISRFDQFFANIDVTIEKRQKNREDKYFAEHPEEVDAHQKKIQNEKARAIKEEEYRKSSINDSNIASSNKKIRTAIIIFMIPIALIFLISAAMGSIDAFIPVLFSGTGLFISAIFWVPAIIVLSKAIKLRND